MATPYTRGNIHGILDHEYRFRPAIDKKTGKPILDAAGKPVMERFRHQLWIPISPFKDVRDDYFKEKYSDKDRERLGLQLKYVTWPQARDRYKTHCATYLSKASMYKVDFLFAGIDQLFQLKMLSDVTEEVGEAWIKKRKDEGGSWETMKRDIDILRNFGRYVADKYKLPEPLFKSLEYPPKMKRKAVIYPLNEEIHRLMYECIPYRSVWYTAAALSLYTGLREAAVCAAEFSDINWIERTIWTGEKPQYNFIPKGYKENILPLHPVLFEYLKELYKEIGDGPIVRKENGSAVRPSVMSQTFRKLLIRFNFRKGLTFHKFRAAYATKLGMIAGAAVVKQALSHSSLQTTDKYVGADIRALREATEKIDYGITSLLNPQQKKEGS